MIGEGRGGDSRRRRTSGFTITSLSGDLISFAAACTSKDTEGIQA